MTDELTYWGLFKIIIRDSWAEGGWLGKALVITAGVMVLVLLYQIALLIP